MYDDLKDKKFIEKANNVIAKYMGLQYCENDLIWTSNINGISRTSVYSGWISNTINYVPGVPIIVVKDNKTIIKMVRKCNYDTDWNILMEVVQKIKNTIGFRSVDECTEEEWCVSTGVTRLTITSSIIVVWFACLKYIEWYNKYILL